MKNEDLNIINKTSPNLLNERLVELKRLFPDLFDGNGNLNEKELKDLLSNYTTPQVEKFTFEWGGKSASKKLAFTPSKATLTPDKGRSVNFNETNNLIIEGDNLHVLKLLQASYASKVKCIYIDPPYNTGKDFIYPDNYRETEKEYWEKNGQVHDGVKLDSNYETNGRLHSSWLSMMQSRLLLGRKLLSDDGVILVSIDDNEVHNLRKLMDEVFGEENFVGTVTWEKRTKAQNTETAKEQFQSKTEYVVIYKKFIEKIKFNLETTGEKIYDLNDEKSAYRLKVVEEMSAIGMRGRSTMVFPIKGIMPKNGNQWKVGIDTVNMFESRGDVELKDGKAYFRMRPDDEDTSKFAPFWSHFFDKDTYGTAETGKAELSDLLGTKNHEFETVKPSKLIKKLIFHTTDKDANDIVLDFFAGSGTTAESVMGLNSEDSGNRKYILIQIPEYTPDGSEAYKAGFKKISDITIERVKNAGIKMAKEDNSVDVGFKVFKQTYSHFPENTWRPDSSKTSEENQKLFKDYLESAKSRSMALFDDFTFEPVLYEVLLKEGFELTFELHKLSPFSNNSVYLAKDNEKETLICLDKTLFQETIDELIANHTKDRFICIENALDTTKKWKLSKALGKNLEVVG